MDILTLKRIRSTELQEKHLIRCLPNGVKDEIRVNDKGNYEIIKRVSKEYTVETFLQSKLGVRFIRTIPEQELIILGIDMNYAIPFSDARDFVNPGGMIKDDIVGVYENLGNLPERAFNRAGVFSTDGGGIRWIRVAVPYDYYVNNYSQDDEGARNYCVDNSLTFLYPLPEIELVQYPPKMSANTKELVRNNYLLQSLINGLLVEEGADW